MSLIRSLLRLLARKIFRAFLASLRSAEHAVAMLCIAREFGSRPFATQKPASLGWFLRGGEGEIRTRGELPHDGFQDRYLKPLGHLSVK